MSKVIVEIFIMHFFSRQKARVEERALACLVTHQPSHHLSCIHSGPSGAQVRFIFKLERPFKNLVASSLTFAKTFVSVIVK